MRQRRRNRYTPSSGHKLAELITDGLGQLRFKPSNIRTRLEHESTLPTVAKLAGVNGAAWAIDQLSTAPHVVKGWPNPCKAARIKMPGKAVRA